MKPSIKRFRATIVAGLITVFLSPIPTAIAQSAESDDVRTVDLYTFDMRAKPLDLALSHLIRQTNISLFYESELVDGRLVDCKIDRADIEQVLACILDGTGLDYYRLSGGTLVLTESSEGLPRTGTIVGQILDAESGFPVRDAHITVDSRNVAVSADESGRFRIPDMLYGFHELTVTHVAYHARRDSIRVDHNAAGGISLVLQRKILRGGPVVVIEGAPPLVSETFDRRRIGNGAPEVVPYGDLSAMPALETGAGALYRDGYGELHVQGGSSGHVEYRIDGVPVFYPIPNGGLITPFSPAAIGSGVVYGAGFGADVGSQLSGVVDFNHAVPVTPGTHALVRFDPVTINGRLTHARSGGDDRRLGVMIAVRKGQFNRIKPSSLLNQFAEWSAPDIYLADILNTGSGSTDAVLGAPADFDVIDGHSAVRMDLGEGREITASGYYGRNEFGSRFFESGRSNITADEYVWMNLAGQLQIDWPVSNRSRVRGTVWAGSYRMNQPFKGSPLGPAFEGIQEPSSSGASSVFNEVSRFGMRGEIDYTRSSNVSGTVGLEAARSDGNFAIRSLPTLRTPDITPDVIGTYPWRVTGYLDRRLATGGGGVVRTGIRVTAFPARRNVYAEPRIAWEQDLQSADDVRFSYRLSGGLYREYMSQLDIVPYTESALLPGFRIWIPPGRGYSPPRAWHGALDMVLDRPNGWRFTARAWHKYSPDALSIDYVRDSVSDYPLESYRLRSTGTRLAVEYERTSTRVELGMTLVSSRMSIPDRFRDRWIASPWNAPRSVDLSIDLNPVTRWTARIRFTATGGRSWAWRSSYYAYLEPLETPASPFELDLSSPGDDYLPVRARADLSTSRTGSVFGGSYSVGLTILNITGRRNVIDRMIAPASMASGFGQETFDRLATPRLLLLSMSISI